MKAKRPTTRVAMLATLLTALVVVLPAAPTAALRPAPPDELYVPPPDHGAKRQIAELTAQQDDAADDIRSMIDTPQAVWFTQGTPRSVRQDVRLTTILAAAHRAVPVLVAYNIPFRDCAQFSAGGATTQAEYEAWIDGFAAGIGDHPAIVILEPDGLGIIPWYDPHGSADGSNALEWCRRPTRPQQPPSGSPCSTMP